MALLSRFLLGALNGLLGPIKAYCCEVSRPEHQAVGISLISTMWGVGLIIGPAIGGYFSQPAEKYPSLFSANSIFGKFPYFLPCLCISLLAAVSLFFSFWLPETLHNHRSTGKEVESLEASEDGHFSSYPKEDISRCETPKRKSLLRNWPLMSSIVSYCIYSLHDMAFTEVINMWAESDRKYGGLSYSSGDLGQVLTITGCVMFLYQFFIYHHVVKLIGPLYSMRISSFFCMPLLVAFPFMTYLSGFVLSLALNSASSLRNVLQLNIITCIFILQNNAVDQDQRGAANGISMTAMSIFKAIGPAGAGVVFSWAQERQHAAFLPGDQLVFFILNVFQLLGFISTFKPFLMVPNESPAN